MRPSGLFFFLSLFILITLVNAENNTNLSNLPIVTQPISTQPSDLPPDSPIPASIQQDTDGDMVIDERDRCPATPVGSVIVDPYTNLVYAGCTCEQVKPHINTSNPCVSFFCLEKILEIKYDAYGSILVDCPEDYCDSYTFVDYPDDGYTMCKEGVLTYHGCEAHALANARSCGYVPPEPVSINASLLPPVQILTPTTTPEPEISSAEQTDVYYNISEANITLTYSETLHQEESALLKIAFSTKKIRTELNPVLHTATGKLINLSNEQCMEIQASLICTGTWDIPTEEVGEEQFTLTINYKGADGVSLTEEIPLTFTILERAFTTEPLKGAIVAQDINTEETSLTPREESFIIAIYDEYAEEETITPLPFEIFKKQIVETAQHFNIAKKVFYNDTTNKTTITLSIMPKEGILASDVTIIEYIPKEIAQDVKDITFATPPHTILNNDPLIMWHFALVDERVDLSYEVAGETGETTNTLVMAEQLNNKHSPWFIIIPMLMIPFLVILLIVVPRMVHHEE
jgi:deoxycytidylate deaminase